MGVMSSGTLASRDRVAQSALDLMDLEDIPRQYASAQLLGAWGKAVRCCAAHALGTMRVECAKHDQMDKEQPAGRFFGSVDPQHIASSAHASLYMIGSIEGQSMAKNKVCPGTRTTSF